MAMNLNNLYFLNIVEEKPLLKLFINKERLSIGWDRQNDKRKKIIKIISYVFITIIVIAFIINMVLNRILSDDSHWNIIRYTFLFSGISLFIVSMILELLDFKN